MLSLGFLTKGFVAFFPWTFPFLIWLLLRQKTFRNMVIDSVGVLISTLAPLAFLLVFFPEAKLSIDKYIDVQVINSIKNIATVDSRFYIVERLLLELIPAIALLLIFMIWGWRKNFSMSSIKGTHKTALVFILLGLTGVLPIMISMKQRGFYILATFPFFAIGMSVLIRPLMDYLSSTINYQSRGFLFFKWLAVGCFSIGIILSVYFSNHIGRDFNKLSDIKKIIPALSQGDVINVYPNMWDDWSLHGYFGRYKNVSLDSNNPGEREYLLIQKNDFAESINQNYQLIELQTADYLLFRRK
jgi:hypothetical protein